jgi:hypothetical protein
MTYRLSPKISSFFTCQVCHYKCCKQSEYTKHILTPKHKKQTLLLTNTASNCSKISSASNIFICKCGKEYKHRQSLFTHRKQCNREENEINKTNSPSDKVLMMMVIQQNAELIKKNDELQCMMKLQ